jgi:O-antigen/teichoic acid export membrane protein
MSRFRDAGLVQNAGALVLSGAASGIIGLGFWGAAAHLTSATFVGRTSAEIAIMTLLAALAQLSFGATFERFIPVAGDQTRNFVVNAYALCAVTALVISVVYELIGLGHSFLPASFMWRLFFVASVILWTIFSLQDAVLVGLRSTRWVPLENIFYSFAKLAILPLFISVTASQGIFVAWVFPLAFLIIAVNWYLFRIRIPRHHLQGGSSGALPSMRKLLVLTGARYAMILINIATASITTLIVIDRLGAVANADYFIPAQIAGGATLVLNGLSRSFIVEAATEPDKIGRYARTTVRTGLVLLTPAIIVGVAFANQILDVFGHSYADHGTTLLRLMMLAIPASAVTYFYSSFAWIDQRLWWFAIRETSSAVVFFVVLLTFLGHFGILAIGIASLVESGVQGVFFLPKLMKRYRAAISGTVAPGASTTM